MWGSSPPLPSPGGWSGWLLTDVLLPSGPHPAFSKPPPRDPPPPSALGKAQWGEGLPSCPIFTLNASSGPPHDQRDLAKMLLFVAEGGGDRHRLSAPEMIMASWSSCRAAWSPWPREGAGLTCPGMGGGQAAGVAQWLPGVRRGRVGAAGQRGVFSPLVRGAHEGLKWQEQAWGWATFPSPERVLLLGPRADACLPHLRSKGMVGGVALLPGPETLNKCLTGYRKSIFVCQGERI